jgi:hypothetical protein
VGLQAQRVQYTFWNPGTKQSRLIEIITPGAFAHYFEELAEILSAGGPPNEEKLANLHAKYEVSYSMDWVSALQAKYGLKLVGEQ